jgi:hypothetical protein
MFIAPSPRLAGPGFCVDRESSSQRLLESVMRTSSCTSTSTYNFCASHVVDQIADRLAGVPTPPRTAFMAAIPGAEDQATSLSTSTEGPCTAADTALFAAADPSSQRRIEAWRATSLVSRTPRFQLVKGAKRALGVPCAEVFRQCCAYWLNQVSTSASVSPVQPERGPT